MIQFTDDDAAVRTALDANTEYMNFVQPNNSNGYIFIQVENAHIVLFHNNDDSFSSFLLPDELACFYNNIDDISRIAKTIQEFAKIDYRTSVKPLWNL